MPDFKDDIPDFDDLDADQPADELSSLDVPDFQADDDLSAEVASDLDEDSPAIGVEEEVVEAEGFDPMAFDGTDAAELELDDEAEEEDEEKKGGLLAALANASPYTVMLGFTLVALAIGIACLFFEWKAYDFDKNAEDPRLRSSVAPVVSSEVAESVFLSAVVRGA